MAKFLSVLSSNLGGVVALTLSCSSADILSPSCSYTSSVGLAKASSVVPTAGATSGTVPLARASSTLFCDCSIFLVLSTILVSISLIFLGSVASLRSFSKASKFLLLVLKLWLALLNSCLSSLFSKVGLVGAVTVGVVVVGASPVDAFLSSSIDSVGICVAVVPPVSPSSSRSLSIVSKSSASLSVAVSLGVVSLGVVSLGVVSLGVVSLGVVALGAFSSPRINSSDSKASPTPKVVLAGP